MKTFLCIFVSVDFFSLFFILMSYCWLQPSVAVQGGCLPLREVPWF